MFNVKVTRLLRAVRRCLARANITLFCAEIAVSVLAGIGAYASIVISVSPNPTPTQQRWLILATAIATILGFLAARAGGYRLVRAAQQPDDSPPTNRSNASPSRRHPSDSLHRASTSKLTQSHWVTILGAILAVLIASGNIVLIAGWLGLSSPFAVSASKPNEAARQPAAESPRASSAAGRATIRVAIQRPGGCSSRYFVEGEVLDPLAKGITLWLVSLLLADPPRNPHSLHYPKGHIPTQPGPYKIELQANTSPGSRKGRFLVVAADKEATATLQRIKDGLDGEGIDPTEQIYLPPGSEIIAQTSDSEQRC